MGTAAGPLKNQVAGPETFRKRGPTEKDVFFFSFFFPP